MFTSLFLDWLRFQTASQACQKLVRVYFGTHILTKDEKENIPCINFLSEVRANVAIHLGTSRLMKIGSIEYATIFQQKHQITNAMLPSRAEGLRFGPLQ